ncbi:hypothetical protein BWQ96_02104 [Gracilariopsis chorda]|uniref:Uncharacterized protein n=1 Tax=Gracilariopsis chorda TaxID=448386 RepID=A0A2V3J162_9FLOR|nr:hypothetical protein BWQ96_02104 [Gracilariopsis chorda]|eukprot:PXF48152.1 hypothetical protein BWQ96_02104 [Gracilariopsis chorda]
MKPMTPLPSKPDPQPLHSSLLSTHPSPQPLSAHPQTTPAPLTPARELLKREPLIPKSPQSALLAHSSTQSLLPSPSASLGMPRSLNAFCQQFLFPSHASSPMWGPSSSLPMAHTSSALPRSASPSSHVASTDVTMLPPDAPAQLSPLPSELPISPGVTSPVPPPMLPQVSASRPRRVPHRAAKPPLAGPSLTAGASALLPPLTNVAPKNPPTHIELGHLEEEHSSSLPALGSPHTELSPLPVASPIFGTSQTPTSPIQPFSPFSGNHVSSARSKIANAW